MMSDMHEEINENVTGESNSAQPTAIQTVHDALVSFSAAADVEAVYRDPIKHGDTLIIPAAELVSVMGFGVGGGDSEEGAGSGGGGGGSVFARPVAVIISSPEGVRVDPVYDFTKIALAGMTTGVLILGTLARVISLRGKIKEIQDEMLKIG
jgi:uncharacterized spore protein YtfJ